jgi:UDP-N-acetyl-D-mannosaminuronic acid dehydrogenase
MRKICVVGLGYIGLPTACLLATHDYQVLGVDTNQKLVKKVNQSKAPFKEPGLDELLREARQRNTFAANVSPEPSDAFLIAVPTPLNKETRMAELKYVREATESIANCLKRGNLVILESTVPPRTCEKLLTPILERSGLKRDRDFHFAHCPERAIPGNTIHEMINNDRVIGGIDRQSAEMAEELYSSFVKGNFYLTDLRTAEMVKLMENTFRDINIALANEFAQIAEESGVNIWEAIELANKHPRVKILRPGPGVGGHCLAIDPWFLTENSHYSRIISLAREINDSMPRHVLDLVKQLLGDRCNATITVLGIAYKGDVDDTRESPTLEFIRLAENEGYKVIAYDPWVRNSKYSLQEAVHDSDCLVLITDHSLFKEIDPTQVAPLMKTRNMVDTRNVIDPHRWEKAGFRLRILGDGKKLK